jgi:ADP-ribosylglycohydrolase
LNGTREEREVRASFDKAYGCLAGLALGDALGMPTEFLTPDKIATEYGTIAGVVSPAPWHPHAALPFASVTDDTEQALALADIYARGAKMTADSAARAILAWADAQGSRLELYTGPSTRRALEALQNGAGPRESGQHGTTNGAAMRIAPIGIVHAGRFDSTLADTVEACLPTHGTTLAISGAAAVSFAVCEAMTETATVDSVLQAAMRGVVEGRQHGAWVWTAPLEHRIALAVRLVRESQGETEARESLYRYVGVDISVSESVPTALGLVALSEGDPMRAVLNAAQIGGDTDTIGAIAGAICGALLGIGAIDRNMLATVERANGLDLAKVARSLADASEGLEWGSDSDRV